MKYGENDKLEEINAYMQKILSVFPLGTEYYEMALTFEFLLVTLAKDSNIPKEDFIEFYRTRFDGVWDCVERKEDES